MAALVIPTIFTIYGDVVAKSKAMGNAVAKDFANKAEKGINKVDGALKRLVPGLGAAAKQFLSFASTAAITAAIISGLNFSYDSIKEYDKAVGSLLAVTGLSKEEFKPFGAEIQRVAKLTKESSIDVARAFETIGSANSSLLSSADAMGQMSQAAITLAQAAGDDLQATAGNLVGVMNQFGLGAESANRAMNVLAAGTKVGAATIPQVADSMKNFGAVANGANISIEQSVALVEVLGTKSIFASEAGNKLKGSILLLQKAGVGYKSGQFNINEALEEAKQKINKLSTAKQKDAAITKMFGAENVVTGKILLENIDLFKKWTGEVTGTNEATIQAAKNNDTLSKATDQLKNAWVNMITGSDKSAAGVGKLKDSVKWLADNLGDVVEWTVRLVATYVALRAIMVGARVAMAIYNIALGINNALQQRSLFYTQGNIYAKNADLVTTKLMIVWTKAATAAQWLWNAAMSANPIGLIIIGIAALIALIVLIVAKWNEWGAALSFVLGPFALLIGMVQSFRRNWDMIAEAFANGGILAGIKAIGVTLLDVLIMPLEQMLGIIAKITGADWASSAAKGVAAFRKDMGVNVTTDENGKQRTEAPLVSTEVEKQAAMTQMFSESVQRQNVAIDIKTDQQNTKMKSDNNLAKIKLSSTLGPGS